MTKRKRRRFSGAEKVALLRRHLVGGEEISLILEFPVEAPARGKAKIET